MNNPIRISILHGIISATIFIPLIYFASPWHWPLLTKFYIWCNIALYSLFLCRWSKTNIKTLFFPLLLHLGFVIWPQTVLSFGLLTLAILSWIRSGICFTNRPAMRVLAEVVGFSVGTLFLLFWLPYSIPAGSLAILLFYLVQTIYFYLFPIQKSTDHNTKEFDPFITLKWKIETLLDKNLS